MFLVKIPGKFFFKLCLNPVKGLSRGGGHVVCIVALSL